MENFENLNRAEIQKYMDDNGIAPARWCMDAGLSPGTLRNYMNGTTKTLTTKTLSKLADVKDITLSLEDGLLKITDKLTQSSNTENKPDYNKPIIPVVGKAGAGEVNFPIDDYAMGDGMYHTERPPGLTGDAVALEVLGDSMEPAFYDGDLVFYQRDYEGVPDRCHNKPCVVQVKDGPVYLKILKPAVAPGHYHLQSLNTKTEIIPDQQIQWAARVLFVKRD